MFGTFTPGGLTGAPEQVASATRSSTRNVALGNFGDIGGTLGGYIIKDKLWFFAGVQWSATSATSYTRSFNARQPTGA